MSQNPPPFPPPTPAKKGLSTGCVVGIVLGALAVLAIPVIAVLAGIAVPVIGGVQMRAKITAASAQAHAIHIGIMMYSSDHNGEFPTGDRDANEALRKLIPKYVEDERPFYVAGSAWHNAAPEKKPDNDLGSPPTYAKALETGENHWAYVSGLTDKSPFDVPLLADGFSDEIGSYTHRPAEPGGVWRGKKAIVTFADGTVKSLAPTSGTLRVEVNGKDLFSPENLPKGTKVLNPK